jgi:GNAT superfamily N-acetyltransferase
MGSKGAGRVPSFEAVLPLVAGYQRFYEAEPDEARNRAAFRRFLQPSEEGILLGAWAGGELVGFACIHWTFSSIHARDMAYLSDVFVEPAHRGTGVGRALMTACQEAARAHGAHHLEWLTAIDNREAQRLYERLGAERSAWFGYEIPLG